MTGDGAPGAPPVGTERLEGRLLRERPAPPTSPRTLVHEAWESEVEGLACGITTAEAGDYGLSRRPLDALLGGYLGLARHLGFGLVTVGRQVHGAEVRRLDAGRLAGGGLLPDGGSALLLAGRVDGLIATGPGILLAVTAADCVPVHLLDARAGRVALLHAGWRGAAAGILERGVDALARQGSDPAALRVHLGPAICGACYEVDEPVLRAFGLPGRRARLDLRGLLVGRALEAGVPAAGVTVSAWCTRCDAGLHSHRGGAAGRMAAYLGMRT